MNTAATITNLPPLQASATGKGLNPPDTVH